MSLLVSACARKDSATRDSATRDSATADSVHVAPRADTLAAPRVVPYNPAAPGPMRSGDTPIRAETPRAEPATPKAPDDSVGDPAAIVRDYYTAIRAHDFLRAYQMWDLAGQSDRKSFAQFESGFDATESVDVRVGSPGRVEGAAGSRYVTVPVEIDSRLRDGTRQRFSGTYTLRRAVVPGASAAQRRWHLYAANIRQVQ